METKIEVARKKYKPEKIKFLFIAEAPPQNDSNRFFYFEDVMKYDSLFIETMKVLYPSYYKSFSTTKEVRKHKVEFLNKFKNDGFYLIDSCDIPMRNSNSSTKTAQIRRSLPLLKRKLEILADKNTKIILISATVYNVCYDELKSEDYNIINVEMIDFPGGGKQNRFREKLTNLLERNNNDSN